MAKTGPKRKIEIDRSELDALYQRISMREIAKHFGCGETVVWNRIKEYGITFKAAKTGRHRKRPPRTDEHKLNISKALRGGKMAGENAHNWRGGLSAINLRLRSTGEYKQWKIASKKRANNCCEECGIKNGTTCACCGTQIKLHCHHLFSFAKFPESRFDPKNSLVLCPKCHAIRHNGKIG